MIKCNGTTDYLQMAVQHNFGVDKGTYGNGFTCYFEAYKVGRQMTTSGTYSLDVTRDQIIEASLRTLGVIGSGETATTEDRTNCAFALNLLLKTLPIETWLLWCYNDVAVPLTSGTSTYTIGPVGDVVGVRPLRIAKGWLRNTNVTPNIDQPMTQLARADYDMLTPKQTPGSPVNFYYDPQLTNGVLYTWPVINTSGYTVYLSCNARFRTWPLPARHQRKRLICRKSGSTTSPLDSR